MASQENVDGSQSGSAYPNDFRRSDLAARLTQQHASADAAQMERLQAIATIAGRLISKETTGPSSRGVVEDLSGRIAIVVSDQASGKANHAAYASWRVGDIVGVGGILCRLPSGELALRGHEVRLLVKALRPLCDVVPHRGTAFSPYVDLLKGGAARHVFDIRWRLIKRLRAALAARSYIEVETPILQPTPDSPAAQFSTHHNALDYKLYLRRSAERYLKRLLVGGVEQVFELNRIFVQAEEGATCEETTLEMYCAYTNDNYMIALLEMLLAAATREDIEGGPVTLDAPAPRLSPPFGRTSVAEAIRKYIGGQLSNAELRNPAVLSRILAEHAGSSGQHPTWGGLQLEVFEKLAAPRLASPTFVAGFATGACGAYRPSGVDAQIAEHFKLYIAGLCVAEGGSVSNDPDDPAQRLPGDPSQHDQDFQRALEYGMPPCSRAQVSLDRLVLALTRPSFERPGETGDIGLQGLGALAPHDGRARIPGHSFTAPKVTPRRNRRDQNPQGASECAGKVSRRRGHADD
jgi:lysyl-tRNA synthetase class 2